MKKITKVVLMVLVALCVVVIVWQMHFNGCDGNSVENALSEQLKSVDEIESIIFIQGGVVAGCSGGVTKEDCAEDIEAVYEIFTRISSDGESFKDYMTEGFHRLYEPAIKIVYSSEESIRIEWKIQEGIFVYNETEYYIDRELAQKLYDIFTKYCPQVDYFF